MIHPNIKWPDNMGPKELPASRDAVSNLARLYGCWIQTAVVRADSYIGKIPWGQRRYALVYLVRHGETGRVVFRLRVDSPLSRWLQVNWHRIEP